MRRRALLATLCSLLCLPFGVAAQRSEGGRYELGAFTSYNRYDPTRLQLSRDYGLGVRGGWFLGPAISLEASAARTPTRHSGLGRGVIATELGASALFNARALGYNQIFAGAGYSRLSYSKIGSNEHAVHGLVGDRIPLSRMSALRVEVRAVYTPSSRAFNTTSGSALTMGLSVGVSLFVDERPPRDSDRDVVPDRHDQCAATPLAAAVDANGCPRDSDGDGAFDGLDRCPASSRGVTVDDAGCEPDADADGFADSVDRCPSVAANRFVGRDGCPADADSDGVWDYLDRCPDTPSGVLPDVAGCPVDTDTDGIADYLDRCEGTPVGQRIDEIGCTLLFQEEAGQRVPLVLQGVTFDLGEATLTEGSFAVLDEVAASLVANADVRVEVGGHTDDVGTDEANLRLSVERAEAVREYLVSRGVDAARLVAQGYGTQQPVASNATEEGRARNRRVELRLIEP